MKPLLAHTIEDKDIEKLTYPVACTPKLDGIRAVVIDGVVYSRSMKPIRSKAVQELFGKQEYNGLDGELLYGVPTAGDCFNQSTSFVMSADIPEGMDKRNIVFYVFDKFDAVGGYLERVSTIENGSKYTGVKILVPTEINSKEELLNYEERCLNVGYEGAMVRDPNGRYKQGRSTLKEGIIGKLKRFKDDEAVVIGFIEKMHNQNEAKVNELGYTERSSSKEGLIGADTLGSICVEHPEFGKFDIGTGLNDEQRKEIWNNRDKYIGKLVKFKYFPIGMKDTVRFPVFLGFRDEDDV